MFLTKLCTTLFATGLFALPCLAQVSDRAVELYSSGDYAKALILLKDRLHREPSDLNIRFMVAQTMFMLGDYDNALSEWLKVEEVTRNSNLVVKEKLIQTYEQLNQPKEVETRVQALLKLREETNVAEYKQKKLFCRDQFSVDGVKFMGFQYFGFPDSSDTYFVIFQLDNNGDIASKFKFWSSDFTNAISKELGELPADQRLYHIDEYRSRSKINHLHTTVKLSYRQFKDRVLNKIKKE